MEQQLAERIEQRVEKADELIERVEHMLEEDDSEKGCDRALEILLPFLTENPLFAYGWLKAAHMAMNGSKNSPLTVDETELALRWACFTNDTWAQPFVDLGDFLLAERKESEAASDSFRAAADLALEQLEDAYVGMIDALNATGDVEELKKMILESQMHFPGSEKIREALKDWQA